MDSPLDLALAVAATTALALVLLVVVLRHLHRRGLLWQRKDKRFAPVSGTLFHQLPHLSRYHDYLTDLTRQNKTFRLLGPTHDEIFTADPANLEYILKTNFPNYGKGWFFADLADLFGEGILVVDGDKWRRQRTAASLEFSTKAMRDFSSSVFQRNAAKLAHIVSEAARTLQILDMQELLMKSTMDSISKVAFGVDLDCLGGASEEGAKFAKAFDESSEVLLWRLINPFWSVWKALNIGPEARLRENVKVLDDFVYKLISRNKSDHSSHHGDKGEKKDMLARFLALREGDPEELSNMKYLRDIVLNFLLAGKDTTAVTLSWFLHALCENPSVQEKVAAEVKEVTKTASATSFEDFAETITAAETLENLHYLHATLSETLRLHPAVPSDSKVCFSDDTLPDGFSVSKGDVVTYQPYPMGRMKFIWGEDAEIFRPERWLDGSGNFRHESPFKFPVFQAGPRACLGKEFAYWQMKIIAAVLLRFFSFESGDEKRSVTYKPSLTLFIDRGLLLRASRRRE